MLGKGKGPGAKMDLREVTLEAQVAGHASGDVL